MDSYQDPYWQTFYEKAWKMRSDYMRDLLKTGQYNTLQIIKMLAKKERFYILINAYGNKIGEKELEWKPIKFEETSRHFTGVPVMKTNSLLGNYRYVPFYTEYRIDKYLVDMIDATGPYDAIVELGCGYGRNLFEIFYNGGPADVCYYGGEYTKSGENICRELATATPSMKAEFFHFDHLEPDLSFLSGKFERLFIFTVHTIEQVNKIPECWFKKVCEAAPFVRGVNIEPFGFQMIELGPSSKAQKEFFIRNNWNLNFANVLKNANERKEVEIEEIMTEHIYSNDLINISSLAVWKHGEDKFNIRRIE